MTREADLFLALRTGDIDAVRDTLRTDPARASARDSEGISLLMTALYHRQGEVVDHVLGLIGTFDAWECAALGRTTDLAAILARTPRTMISRSPDGFTLLHIGAFFGQAEVADHLVRQGATVDAVAANPSLARPLHSAVAAGSVRVVQVLLDAGAELDAVQHGGWTALHGAAHRGDSDLVDLLLHRGARADVRSDDGRTPADVAREKDFEAIASRLDHG